jgi:hypothetical protein
MNLNFSCFFIFQVFLCSVKTSMHENICLLEFSPRSIFLHGKFWILNVGRRKFPSICYSAFLRPKIEKYFKASFFELNQLIRSSIWFGIREKSVAMNLWQFVQINISMNHLCSCMNHRCRYIESAVPPWITRLLPESLLPTQNLNFLDIFNIPRIVC